MTLELITKSHGNIESGFFAAYTSLFRMGDYTFATQHLYELITHIAKNSPPITGTLFTFNADAFSEGYATYNTNLVKKIAELDVSVLEKFIESKQGKISPEQEKNVYQTWRKTPVTVTSDTVTIGKYIIAGGHFEFMAVYACNGGWFGWSREAPFYAKAAAEAIQGTENPLFKSRQKTSKSSDSQRNH